MKKTKLIAFALVLTVICVGAGYAYWSETLTINNTVDTGELNVEFAPGSYAIGDYDGIIDLPDDIWDIIDNPRDISGSEYMEVSVEASENNHKLSYNVNDIYPGAGSYLSFKIVNTGTVPAKLNGVESEIKIESLEGLKDEFEYVIHDLVLVRRSSGWFGIPKADIDIVEAPIKCQTFDEFISELDDLMSGYTLDPGNFFQLNNGDLYSERAGYNIEMPSSLENNDFEDANFDFDLLLNFTQTK